MCYADLFSRTRQHYIFFYKASSIKYAKKNCIKNVQKGSTDTYLWKNSSSHIVNI
jgi:hypothetical protein